MRLSFSCWWRNAVKGWNAEQISLHKRLNNLLSGKLDYPSSLSAFRFSLFSICSFLFLFWKPSGAPRPKSSIKYFPPSINLRAAVRRRFHLRDMKRFVALWDYWLSVGSSPRMHQNAMHQVREEQEALNSSVRCAIRVSPASSQWRPSLIGWRPHRGRGEHARRASCTHLYSCTHLLSLEWRRHFPRKHALLWNFRRERWFQCLCGR